MSLSYQIRDAHPSDAKQIADLGSRVFTASFGYSLTPEDLAAYLEDAYSLTSILADLDNPLKHTTVAYDEGNRQVLGFALLTQGTSEPCIAHIPSQIELQRLYVRSDCHGLGVGRRLMERAEGLARQWRFRTMWLGVWEENFKAQKVYERLGFTKVGEHDFKMGGCVQTDWILVKEL